MTNTTILMAEDNPNDEELTLRALRKYNVSNEVVVVRDGQEALDYLFCAGEYASRSANVQPQVILLDINLPNVHGSTPLHEAAQFSDVEVVEFLTLHGADINAVNRFGETLMQSAARMLQHLLM